MRGVVGCARLQLAVGSWRDACSAHPRDGWIRPSCCSGKVNSPPSELTRFRVKSLPLELPRLRVTSLAFAPESIRFRVNLVPSELTCFRVNLAPGELTHYHVNLAGSELTRIDRARAHVLTLPGTLVHSARSCNDAHNVRLGQDNALRSRLQPEAATGCLWHSDRHAQAR